MNQRAKVYMWICRVSRPRESGGGLGWGEGEGSSWLAKRRSGEVRPNEANVYDKTVIAKHLLVNCLRH